MFLPFKQNFKKIQFLSNKKIFYKSLNFNITKTINFIFKINIVNLLKNYLIV